jgi:hypothetical protein
MIEVLKQAYQLLLTEPPAPTVCDQLEVILRQAIAGLESQEPVALETVYETIIQWDESGGKRSRRELARRIIALYNHPLQRTEQNFCPRCGKRTNDIHTCTPPQRTEQEPVQVSPLEFVEMVMEKEHLIGKPIFWAEWPNQEKNT